MAAVFFLVDIFTFIVETCDSSILFYFITAIRISVRGQRVWLSFPTQYLLPLPYHTYDIYKPTYLHTYITLTAPRDRNSDTVTPWHKECQERGGGGMDDASPSSMRKIFFFHFFFIGLV